MLPSPEAKHLEALRDGAKVMPNESFQRLLDLAGEILGPDEPSFHDPAFEPKWRRVDPEELTEQERLANQKPADTPEQKAARLDAFSRRADGRDHREEPAKVIPAPTLAPALPIA